MNELLNQAATRLSGFHYLLLALNIVLLVLARPILEYISNTTNKQQFEFQLKVLRGLNLLLLAVTLYYGLYSGSSLTSAGKENPIPLRLASILIVLYLSYLAASISSSVVRRKYGKRHTNSEGVRIADTYHSRLLALVISTFIAIAALIAIVGIAGFSNLLEAGGVIGFVGVFLALTQAAWAPDIISGLVLLNSDMVSEGDLIEIENPEPFIGRVFKTKIFHTVLIDVVNNHRVMIGNARLRDFTIHNLSKFASAKGLREKLVFKIGYDVSAKQVAEMFEQAFNNATENERIAIDYSHPLEIRVLDTGDHAIEWGVFYYVKDVQNLIGTRQFFVEQILTESIRCEISLSTPQTHVVSKAEAIA